ncbi:unnamed protein product [Amoebophrya sp. A120]|nr:unnamed protein product [Amoebophrya sp. A120]|eukprot:GSA120T00000153001.1
MSGTGLPFITTTVCAAAEGATTADVYWGGSVTWGSDFSAGTASGAADLIPRRLASHVAAKGVSYSMALTAKPVDAADQTASAAIMATATANVNSNLATAVSSKVATELATLPGNYTINAPTVSVAPSRWLRPWSCSKRDRQVSWRKERRGYCVRNRK